ncbi:MAG: copper chaperone PCu(A)C [Kocuria sp.]|nr:copper chaperone PCu(A)C [Kocuria sp.]
MNTNVDVQGVNATDTQRANTTVRCVIAATAVGVMFLSGCSSAPEHGGGSAAETTSAQARQSIVTVEQPWMKAADSGMTAVFATVINDGDSPVTLSGAEAVDIAESTQLHETVMDDATGSTVMQEMTEPLEIAPGESVTLEPGGDHIMLMDLTCSPHAGQNLQITLNFSDDRTQTVEVPVRDYQGAQEEYSHETENPDTPTESHGQGVPAEQDLPMCEEPS